MTIVCIQLGFNFIKRRWVGGSPDWGWVETPVNVVNVALWGCKTSNESTFPTSTDTLILSFQLYVLLWHCISQRVYQLYFSWLEHMRLCTCDWILKWKQIYAIIHVVGARPAISTSFRSDIFSHSCNLTTDEELSLTSFSVLWLEYFSSLEILMIDTTMELGRQLIREYVFLILQRCWS